MYPEHALEKIREIVNDCMGDAAPFCQAACPMHTDVRGYVGLIAEGKYMDAIRLIREEIFLPGVLGRICAHPCEKKCRRSDIGVQPMSIAALKRFASQFDAPEDWDMAKEAPTGKKVAVIGAGPAGAQAALDLTRMGHSVTIFDRNTEVGGMLRYGIPEYRLPRNVIDSEYSYLKKMGVEFRMNREVGRDVTFSDLRENFDAVLIAAGSQKSIGLSIPGAELKGVIPVLDLLRKVNVRREYPLQPTMKDAKRAVVIGGGNVAMDAARTLRRLGVEEVHIFYRRMLEEMPANPWEVKEAVEEGVEIHTGWDPVAITGSERVERIKFRRSRTVVDEKGIAALSYDDDVTTEMITDNVVLAIGQEADVSFVGGDVKTSRGGRVDVDPDTLETSAAGVFAAGDAVIRTWLAVEVMALGRKAAKSIDRYLKGQDLREGRDFMIEGAYETKLETDVEGEERVDRVATRQMKSNERVRSFEEFDSGLSEKQALKEASRCLKCECRHCVKDCLMLSDYCHCPKELFQVILEGKDLDPLIPYSCNMCGQCTLVCPKDFRMADRFHDVRKKLVKEGRGPLPGHKPIKVHQKLSFSKFFNVTVPAPGMKVAKRVFFPGCSLPSYNPGAVGATQRYLQERLEGVGAVLKCCGKPLKALGVMDDFEKRFETVKRELDRLGAEEIIVACQSCYVTFKQYDEGRTVRSLWDLFREIGVPEKAKGIGKDSGITLAIHDSCVTRDVSEIHDGIRFVLSELGYDVEELDHSRENTGCCGFGGMIVPANPSLAKRVMDRRASEAKSDYMVTYCAACRASMVAGGKKGLHILDLVFGGSWKDRPTPAVDGPLASWVKRWKSKQELLR
jgi:NADPH-dependent glutamate synthase beta subunit-like oxidoreductase/Fe-S oxidoreductase